MPLYEATVSWRKYQSVVVRAISVDEAADLVSSLSDLCDLGDQWEDASIVLIEGPELVEDEDDLDDVEEVHG